MLPEQIGLLSDDPQPPRCPYCGSNVAGRGGLCFSHVNPDRDWAAANRAMCDFLHRGRLTALPRRQELLAASVNGHDGDDPIESQENHRR
jgi:hypothetical protein